VPGTTVSFDWVVVAEPGNPADDEVMRCCEAKIGLTEPTSGYGAVSYRFRITRTEVPTWAYVEFLNAVGADDPHLLFNPAMQEAVQGTIVRSGFAGAFLYAAKPGREQEPVVYVDWYRAARFANWIHNGQPVGPQDTATTEDGAYTLLGQNPIGITRNAGSRVWIPSEDEFYKAAYHVPGGGWVDYATGSDVPPMGEPPPGGPDSANYCPPESLSTGYPCLPEESNGPNVATNVGAYPLARSAWGIQDGVGNVIEILEEHYCCSPQNGKWMAPARGGPYDHAQLDNASYGRNFAYLQINGCLRCGFRLAATPAPRCGLGFELALPLALLARIRARRLRRPRSLTALPRDLPGI
jgi:formylglycine-generating enzyme required for sulfatase activity